MFAELEMILLHAARTIERLTCGTVATNDYQPLGVLQRTLQARNAQGEPKLRHPCRKFIDGESWRRFITARCIRRNRCQITRKQRYRPHVGLEGTLAAPAFQPIVKQPFAAGTKVGASDKFVPGGIQPFLNGCAAEETRIPPNRDVCLPRQLRRTFLVQMWALEDPGPDAAKGPIFKRMVSDPNRPFLL
ncbi:hypothetical protein [Bradyrhizobium glycinis]|uniref:hypothetical protein n=1 Tax=Bradyrhizobium glycinis TaxID=2751812 RepID=UPI0018D94215|nr:hypothetical protein [Bradyrhizobium glycinis]MBH5373149.1 hypothetical protein [Bradyrhizobium glycinis]